MNKNEPMRKQKTKQIIEQMNKQMNQCSYRLVAHMTVKDICTEFWQQYYIN